MRRSVTVLAAITFTLTFYGGSAPADELSGTPTIRLAQLLAQRGGNSLPKGSYQQSCTCRVSGGTTLLCFCANLQGKMFESDIDLRSCSLPKDIKNCDGKLTCVDPKSGQC